MTPEEPLSQLEQLQIGTQRQVDANTSALSDLRLATSAMIETVTHHQQNFEVVVNEIKDIKQEIRGLQTENRRILDHLFGQQGEGQ